MTAVSVVEKFLESSTATSAMAGSDSKQKIKRERVLIVTSIKF